MSKYSKTKLKLKLKLPILIILFVVIFLLALTFVIYLTVKNNIVIQKIDDSAKLVSDQVAAKSSPIIINNLVVGAVSNKEWVSNEKYYFKSNIKENTDIDIYSKTGKAGKYSILNIEKDENSSSEYVSVSRSNKIDEYFAIYSNGGNNMQIPAISQEPTDEDRKLCLKALGIYKLLNNTINIDSVYGVYIDSSLSGKIICITNKSKTIFGAYSAVIFVDNNNVAKIIKYNYIKDVKNAQDWPIYAFEFCADLNSDGKNEVILQETTENKSQYDILEYRDNNFYQVLSMDFNI